MKEMQKDMLRAQKELFAKFVGLLEERNIEYVKGLILDIVTEGPLYPLGFTPIHSQILQEMLVHTGKVLYDKLVVSPYYVSPLQSPYPKWYDTNIQCTRINAITEENGKKIITNVNEVKSPMQWIWGQMIKAGLLVSSLVVEQVENGNDNKQSPWKYECKMDNLEKEKKEIGEVGHFNRSGRCYSPDQHKEPEKRSANDKGKKGDQQFKKPIVDNALEDLSINVILGDEAKEGRTIVSPDEIWKKLESQFMSKSLTTKLYLKQRLYGLMMQDDHDLAQHVNVINQIVYDLARIDVKIEDEEKAMILLCSFPPSYEHIVITLTYGKENIKVEEIIAALLAHNQRKQNGGESSQADSLYVKGNRDPGRKLEKMYDGFVRTLCGVQHIPDLKKNLISLGTLHKNGFIPKADKDRETIWIVKEVLTVMKGKMNVGIIYRLLRSTVVGGIHSVESYDDTTKLCHMRLAQLSECGIAELHKRNTLHGVKSCKLNFCKYSVLVKQNKVRFKTGKHTTERILDYVHSDVWGPSTTSSLGGSTAQDITTNGVAERMNRSLKERARCLRLNTGLPKHFWAEAVNMACYLINRSPKALLAGKVVEEVWTGHYVTFDHLRIFGCPAYVHVPADERSKLDAKLKECIFLGYKKGVKGFKLWDPVAKKIVIDRDDYSLARDRVIWTNIKPLNRLGFEDLVSFSLTGSSDDPVTSHSAVTRPKNDKWMAAMVEEMESLNHNRTWELVRLPKEEPIYMQQPKGFTQPGNEHLVYKLKKSFLDDVSFIFLLLYVDDMLIDVKNIDDGQRLRNCGYLNGVMLRKRFVMSSAKPVSTPLANHFKLSSEQCPKTDKEAEDMAKVLYSNTVGCLMYAMVCTRPDLAHVVSQVCKYMSKPGKQHWEAVKWIFRYLKGTMGHGIVFGSQRDNSLVIGYVDSYYADDLDNRRSMTGYFFTLGGGPICWKSIVQSVVVLSTTEAEYMAIAEAAKEALGLLV
ncbi:putative ribonuclease H protein [Hibiscus syriacus]|uniref:Ribonuclease H protein n=1 Tax=Hibiscus syriacus TaxID=106335 RepID=A0A6A2Y2I8_HIBSY|nr:putative ribonuclease H protein [Hibiscus syriacus]